MSAQARYQIALLDPADGPLRGTLRATIRTHVKELGLDPGEHLRFLDEGNYEAEIQPREPLVGAYFGNTGRSEDSSRVLKNLLDRFAYVLPIVDSTDGYSRKVPDCLHRLNGVSLDPGDPKLERVAGRLLEELRLLRPRRVAFVSYRRAESRGVGTQIFHALEERHYHVFLDTFSVEYGRPFQEALWNRMLDTDVLVFLHTRGALLSRWVEEEFARAAQLGIGVLNIIWPGHTPAPEAAIGDQLYLETVDFAPGLAPEDGNAVVNLDVLRRIAIAVEALRARTIADRRRRVIETFCRRVDAFIRRTGTSNLRVIVLPTGYLEILRGRRKAVLIHPVIGHPDTTYARDIADACSVLQQKGYLLFDRNGIDDTTAAHLRWLNTYLPVKAFSTTEVEEWLPRL